MYLVYSRGKPFTQFISYMYLIPPADESLQDGGYFCVSVSMSDEGFDSVKILRPPNN